MIEDKSVPMLPPVGEKYYTIPVSNSPTSYVWCVDCGLETNTWKTCQIQTVDTCDRSSNFIMRFGNQDSDIN